MNFIICSIFLVGLFSASGLAGKDEAASIEQTTFVEPVTRGNRERRFTTRSRNTEITVFPHHVSVEHNNQTICSGAIISANFVLTAANCRVDDLKNLLVRAGSSNRGSNGTLHHIARFTIHDQFTFPPKSSHDIGVIRVREPFKFNIYNKPIEIFQIDEEIKPGSMVDITGFGLASQKLQHAAALVELCYNESDSIPSDTLCAGYWEQNTRFGDTGSPLTNGLRLVGIMSYESNCGNYRGIFTKIAHYRGWIARVMGTDI